MGEVYGRKDGEEHLHLPVLAAVHPPVRGWGIMSSSIPICGTPNGTHGANLLSALDHPRLVARFALSHIYAVLVSP